MQEGDYLLSHVGFSSDNHPFIYLQDHDRLYRFDPIGHTLTLHFDTSERFCRGWHDLRTGEDAACPDNQQVDIKYDQCAACQSRTGFNPAFYYAKTVSPQQEARNLEPHFLYLAYFANDIVKVGISHAKRGNARLLEQGARSAVILETFPTAHVARHYEEQIAALPGIYETVQLSKKLATLKSMHDSKKAATTLAKTKENIESLLNVTFSGGQVHHFDTVYFPGEKPELQAIYDCSSHHFVSGKVTGMIGSTLFCLHKDTPVFLPLKKRVGYRVKLSATETPINLPAQQVSLF